MTELNHFNFIKIKTFYPSKETIKKTKIQATDWVKMLHYIYQSKTRIR